MIATTIEQSKHLLELGLDPKTADMYYPIESSIPEVCCAGDNIQADNPAWSLSTLLDVMPKEMLPALEWREGDKEWEANVWVNRNLHCISHYDKLCAVYSMVCWFLEQGLIKKGGQ